jgi:nitrite reductase/ring-hydroxylating ferredoxin subunit
MGQSSDVAREGLLGVVELVLIGRVEDLPPGTRKVVKTQVESVLVVNVAGEVLAVSNVCPHSGGYLQQGPLTGTVIECPLHFWPFDLRTGCLVGMPDSYDDHLNTYQVCRINEELFLEIPPELV